MTSENQKIRTFSLINLLPELIVCIGYIFWLVLILFNKMPVWGDEYFTFKVASFEMNDTISSVLQDAHPPLYWIIANIILEGSIPEILPLRIISAAFGVFAIYVISLVVLQNLKDKSSVLGLKTLFLIVALTSPYAILFFPMARYYSLFAMLVALSLLIKSREKQSLLGIIAIIVIDALMLYTNFLAGLVLIGSWIYLITRRTERLSIGKLLSILVFPWILFIPVIPFLFQVFTKIKGQQYFTSDFGAGIKGLIVRLGYTWHAFISGEFIYPWQPSGIMMILISIYLIYRFVRYSKTDIKRLIGWGILLPAFITVIASISLFSLGMEFLPSRLAFAQGFFLLAIVMGLSTITNKYLRWCLLILILLGNLHADYKFIKKENFLHSTYVIPWHQIAEDIKSNMDRRNDIILYDDEALDYELNQSELFPPAYNISSANVDLDQVFRPNRNKRIWLVFSPRDITPDKKLDRLFQILAKPFYDRKIHFHYVEESDKAIKMKERILGRNVAMYKKEVILFTPFEEYQLDSTG